MPHDAATGVDEGETAQDGQARRDEVTRRVNSTGQRIACAIEAAGLAGDDTVLDLYCGTGTLTLLMARAAGRAVGVESVPQAVTRARANAARNSITNVISKLGPTKEQPKGPFGEVIESFANGLAGKGKEINTTFNDLSRALTALNQGRGDFFAVVRSLALFVNALHADDQKFVALKFHGYFAG